VYEWIARNPGLKAVRGWLIIGGEVCGLCQYAAHSVIREDGEFYDITLDDQRECDAYPFLEHIGTEDEFWEVERNHKQVFWPRTTTEEAVAATWETEICDTESGAGDDSG
jgi:hypothetical protein